MKTKSKEFKIQIISVTETTMIIGLDHSINPSRRKSDIEYPLIRFKLIISDFEIKIIKQLDSPSDGLVCTAHTKTIFKHEDRLIKFHRAYNRVLLNANADLSS